MATRSIIGYYNEETNKIHATYCHLDGYPEWMVDALRDLVTDHGFDAFAANIENAAKGGGIRSIPKNGKEWNCFNESDTDWLETLPAALSAHQINDLYQDSGIEHVWVLSRQNKPLVNKQSAIIAHMPVGSENSWTYRDAFHMPKSAAKTDQMVLSFA